MSPEPIVYPPTADEDRIVRIARVVACALERRAAGESMPDSRVLAEHADLMPELARSLREAASVRRAFYAARRSGPAGADQMLDVLSDAELDAPIADDEAVADLPVGDAVPIIDGYEVTSALPRGGQAVVYVARQLSTGQTVAVKVLTGGRFATVSARRRFDREVEILAALDHPHLVRVVDAGTARDGSPFLVMPFVEGQCLDEHWSEPVANGGLGGADATAVLSMGARIARAVHAAHTAGVIHRDLKPSNIRVDRSGEPRILDFGLARLLARPAGTAGGLELASRISVTHGPQILGTPAWMSPEQAAGSIDRVDARSDVYSIGVILFHALAGRSPYPEEQPAHRLLAHVLGTEPPLPSHATGVRRGVDRGVDAVILKCLAKNPDDRYQTALALAEDLERCWAGVRPLATVAYAARRRGRRDRAGLKLAAMAAATVSIAAVVLEASGLGMLGWGTKVNLPPQAVPIRFGSVPPPMDNKPPDGWSTLSCGAALVRIPGGSMLVREPNSGLDRRVRVSPYWIGSTEVTRAQYEAVMGGPVDPSFGGLDLPVTGVTRAEAEQFCRRLTEQDRLHTYRLPTEVEWEFAARGGRVPANAADPFVPAAVLTISGWYAGDSGGHLHPVARRVKSPFGLYDMNGNAAEWCIADDPAVGVVRGGAYDDPAERCSNGSRRLVPIGKSSPGIGFRIARTDEETPATRPAEK